MKRVFVGLLVVSLSCLGIQNLAITNVSAGVFDCVKAKRKIGFIHNDYVKLDLDASFDLPYFEKLNTIATVSEQCVMVLKEVFPTQKDKVQLLYNIVSAILIK